MTRQSSTNDHEQQNFPEILRDPQFLLGAAKQSQFPQDNVVEVAFAGRSNVGKSSAINALCNRRKLARTSKVPGRTQQINFFSMGEHARLVDLPGYGYAQVPLEVKRDWEKTIHTYLSTRDNLIILVLLMDIRHPLTKLDWQMLEWASVSDLPTQILLTKADKLKRGKMSQTLINTERELENLTGNFAVEAFSSQNFLGVDKIRGQMQKWVEQSTI